MTQHRKNLKERSTLMVLSAQRGTLHKPFAPIYLPDCNFTRGKITFHWSNRKEIVYSFWRAVKLFGHLEVLAAPTAPHQCHRGNTLHRVICLFIILFATRVEIISCAWPQHDIQNFWPDLFWSGKKKNKSKKRVSGPSHVTGRWYRKVVWIDL